MSTAETTVEPAVLRCGWLRNARFDLTLIGGVALLALVSGLVVLLNPDLFVIVLVLDLWCLGYPHVISTFTRLSDPQLFAASHVSGLLPARMDALLLGVIAAVLFRQPQFREQVRKSQRSIWICVILLGAALLFFAMQGFGLGSVLMSVIGFSVIAYFYLGVLILTLCSKNATLSRVLTFKPLRFLGQVSFFVYLFHYPVLGIVHHVLRGRTPSFADGILPTLLALGITLLAGWVSWHFLERHLVGMGHRFSYGSNRGD